MGKLNKARGNMYKWVTHTWDPFKPFKCAHECSYCYAARIRERFGIQETTQPELDLPFPELGVGKTIFVGHMSDIWAENIDETLLQEILIYCIRSKNQFVLQSKNPGRFLHLQRGFQFIGPSQFILGSTIESNITDFPGLSRAPSVAQRIMAMCDLKYYQYRTFITIEPILQFNLDNFLAYLHLAKPDFINLGADSKNSGLPEPTSEEIEELIRGIRGLGIELRLKENLKRLYTE